MFEFIYFLVLNGNSSPPCLRTRKESSCHDDKLSEISIQLAKNEDYIKLRELCDAIIIKNVQEQSFKSARKEIAYGLTHSTIKRGRKKIDIEVSINWIYLDKFLKEAKR